MTGRRIPRQVAAAAVIALSVFSASANAQEPLAFEVRYAKEVAPGPLSTRVYVILARDTGRGGEPRTRPLEFNPDPIFAVQAKDWNAGEPLHFGREALSYPQPISGLRRGKYLAQAVVRLNRDTHAIGAGEGNAYGPVVAFEVGNQAGQTITLTVDKVVPGKPFRETELIKLVDIPSPLLSAFHHREIRHKAAVVIPEGDQRLPRPTLYVIPGFGGDHHRVHDYVRSPVFKYATDMIRVILNPDCGTGHHVFADSAYNGPRARALIEELIPHIEKTFPAIAEPRARLLNGHSSGGWSSLWLQVTYPDFFGGTWSTSPDPVDFRDFQAINLYAAGANLYRDRDGSRRPIARPGNSITKSFPDFARLDDVIGNGGQLHSFEAVFSPLDSRGEPRLLWDRATGAIDPAVARAWEDHDIRLVLERNWKTLGPKLAGKLHVVTGDRDTYYLEGAVKLLKKSLSELGSDAVVEISPGRDHRTVLDPALARRINAEMKAAIKKHSDTR